jgi:hypothetical protein
MPDKACAGSTCEESARDIFVSGTDVYIAETDPRRGRYRS